MPARGESGKRSQQASIPAGEAQPGSLVKGMGAGASPGDIQLQALLQASCVNLRSSFDIIMLQIVLSSVYICSCVACHKNLSVFNVL